jgi:hypothetical protein
VRATIRLRPAWKSGHKRQHTLGAASKAWISHCPRMTEGALPVYVDLLTGPPASKLLPDRKTHDSLHKALKERPSREV